LPWVRTGPANSRLVAHDPGETLTLTDAADISPGDTHWANYLLGVAAQFQQRGGGESRGSTARLGTHSGGAACRRFMPWSAAPALRAQPAAGNWPDTTPVCRPSRPSTPTPVGVKCGIMDQFASPKGKLARWRLLDCRSLDYAYFPLIPRWGLPHRALQLRA
jgi:galactokinase